MKTLAVTVIIPTLNCRKKLINHINKSQEWLPYVAEIIAIDSSSTDGTWEVLHERLTPLGAKLISTGPGLYQAWNHGVSQATQPFIYFSTIGDIISRDDIYKIHEIISSKSLDLIIAPPRMINESGKEEKSTKWPIHYIANRLPDNTILLLDQKEKILLASAFLPESIIGSSASNIYRSDILKLNPFPVEFGHQGDVAWAIRNIPNIKTGIYTSIIGNFCLDGNRFNSPGKIIAITENLTLAYSDNSALHHNGDPVTLAFLDHYHTLNTKKFRIINRLNDRFERFSAFSKNPFLFYIKCKNMAVAPYNIFKEFTNNVIRLFGLRKVSSINQTSGLYNRKYVESPTISIITPSFNQAVYAPEMLTSLNVQQYPDLEHIVYDAGSTDGVIDIWRKVETEGKLKLFVEPDRGQSDAINKGMRVATGEIVGWLNSDDVLLPGALHAVVEAFRLNPQAVVICGSGGRVSRDCNLMKIVEPKCAIPGRINKAFEGVQPAMFFRRDAYWKVGGLDESLHYAMDWDLLLKLSKIGKVVTIPQHLANIRYYEETKTNTGGWKRMREIARIGRRHNGPLDRNNLSFQIRDLLSKQPFRLPRSLFDHLCWNLFKDPPLMVQGWPAEMGKIEK
jgi:glycosyltransferase involved in cell wall biosynthesis